MDGWRGCVTARIACVVGRRGGVAGVGLGQWLAEEGRFT